MLKLPTQQCARFCDGISRRDFLRIGALSVGGLTLADLLRLRAQGAACSPKAVIMVLLRGGPSHIDTYDPKPDAPTEIRGPFKPIATNVAGVQVAELLPLQAKIMDQLAIVRNLRFGMDSHSAAELLTGRAEARELTLANNGVRGPAFGSVVSRLSAAIGAASLCQPPGRPLADRSPGKPELPGAGAQAVPRGPQRHDERRPRWSPEPGAGVGYDAGATGGSQSPARHWTVCAGS